ncbi:MAG: FHA domain-containing protein [Hyphomicrobiaceae bacterium]
MTASNGSDNDERRMGGSLREALAAAARSGPLQLSAESSGSGGPPALPEPKVTPVQTPVALPSASEAAREARGSQDSGSDMPRTRVTRAPSRQGSGQASGGRTQLVRGKTPARRGEFHQDPVVGWLVVVGGLGLGAFRPIYEGNNTVGRAASQRIPIDFGDESISGEEQAYIRYDSVDRRFLLVPNLAKTNIVAVNDQKPTGAVELSAMDVITMGRTQLVFVPFCGSDFDWGELTEIED